MLIMLADNYLCYSFFITFCPKFRFKNWSENFPAEIKIHAIGPRSPSDDVIAFGSSDAVAIAVLDADDCLKIARTLAGQRLFL
jgi:hypothetical protein